MTHVELPRVMIAGLAGDTGKSLVSLGLVRAIRELNFSVSPFKKGPDFIDAAWLGRAALKPCRNLDTFLMPEAAIHHTMHRAAASSAVAVVEGNRGLFDGLDAVGSHSSAQLARLSETPVVLVLNVTKVTRTAAALILGCQKLDPELQIGGVILNRVANARHEKIIGEAIGKETGLPVLGSIPKLRSQHLPSRHLGLVTAGEHADADAAIEQVAAVVKEHVDVPAVLALAKRASALPGNPPTDERSESPSAPRARIGVLRDAAFSFYYPENLEALEQAGAELVPISTVSDESVPPIDALFAGGGFPEEHAKPLSDNRPLRQAIAQLIYDGLPVWAECGGLMYLSEGITVRGERFPMVGALPLEAELKERPAGHGYVEATVDAANPFLSVGTRIRGHEFHYSRLVDEPCPCPTVLDLQRGSGVGGRRDGVTHHNVLASYTHIHALGAPEWAPALVEAAVGADS